MNRVKRVLTAAAVLVGVLLVVLDVAVSGYLVNYAIGRAGDGGDRSIEEVAVVESEGTEGRIEAN